MDRSSTVSTGPAARVVGVDIARALALIGMMLVHVLPTTDPSTGEATALGLVATGRPSALFALLAGVGLALMTGGAQPHRDAERVSRHRRSITVRALLVIVIGLLVASWESQVAIILVHYGVLFLLALPLLRWSARALSVLAAVWVLAAPVVFQQMIVALMGDPSYPSEMRLWHSPGFTDVIDTPGLTAWDLTVTGYYPLLIWPAYLLVGMAVGRSRLHRRATAWRLLGLGAGLAMLSAAVSWTVLLRTDLTTTLDYYGEGDLAVRGELLTGTLLPVEADPRWFLLATPHSGSTADLVHTVGTSLLILGACLLIASHSPSVLGRCLSPLIGAGAMPLTLYVGHLGVLHAWHVEGWPLYGLSSTTMAAALVIGCLAAGALQQALGRRGPLEALVHAASGQSTHPGSSR